MMPPSLRDPAGMSFVSTDALAGSEHRNRYDLVVCMEVLEHCPDESQVAVLDQIAGVSRARRT